MATGTSSCPLALREPPRARTRPGILRSPRESVTYPSWKLLSGRSTALPSGLALRERGRSSWRGRPLACRERVNSRTSVNGDELIPDPAFTARIPALELAPARARRGLSHRRPGLDRGTRQAGATAG